MYCVFDKANIKLLYSILNIKYRWTIFINNQTDIAQNSDPKNLNMVSAAWQTLHFIISNDDH